MPSSANIALAAHLHVVLRRRTGRVTDTEWMASNAEYAREIIRFARAKAQEDGHEDLALWAGKLEAAMLLPPRRAPTPPQAAVPAPRLAPVSAPIPLRPTAPDSQRQPLETGSGWDDVAAASGFGHSIFGETGFLESTFGGGGSGVRRRDPNAPRYVGGIR